MQATNKPDVTSALSLVFFVEVKSSITSALLLVEVEFSEIETFEKALLSSGFFNLSRMVFGGKGYIPALRNPDTILLMVIPLDQA